MEKMFFSNNSFDTDAETIDSNIETKLIVNTNDKSLVF